MMWMNTDNVCNAKFKIWMYEAENRCYNINQKHSERIGWYVRNEESNFARCSAIGRRISRYGFKVY